MKTAIQNILDRNFTRGNNKKALDEIIELINTNQSKPLPSDEDFRERIAEELTRQELIDRLCEDHEKIKKLEFMIENGLGWEDMINDITLPNEI